jgi:hypothetical protein
VTETIACKGTLYVSARMFTEQRFGARAVELALKELPVADREMLSSCVAVGWYPVEPVLRFHRAVDALHGAGDLALCKEMGRFGAEWSLNLFHKFILRFKTPAWFLEKGAKMWLNYFDKGRWEISQPAPQQILARLHEFPLADEAFCKREHGWFQRAAEMTGAKEVILTERLCRTRGHNVCEYFGEWQ